MKGVAKESTHSFGKKALLLSIRPEFAERILNGKKKFELRKRLPKKDFHRVYLYQTSGVGIVGCFDVVSIRSKPVRDLWDDIGELGTSKDRFFNYFNSCKIGHAIEVGNPVQFPEPYFLPELKKLVPTFIIPQGFIYLNKEQILFKLLEIRRKKSLAKDSIQLQGIIKKDYAEYKRLVTEVIAPRYDDITGEFPSSILKSHELGHDPNGIMTVKKEVLAIHHKEKGHVGYTTLTYKRGHALKTGPTIIKPRFRGKGLGLEVRRAIENYAIQKGKRKLYCTCPDDEPNLSLHFIRAGYRIEGHLQSHYQMQRGEILFGKVLEHAVSSTNSIRKLTTESGKLVASTSFRKELLIGIIARLFSSVWLGQGEEFAKQIVRLASRRNTTVYEDKPLKIYCLKSKNACIAALLLIEKRGGAVKALLLSSTKHQQSLERMVKYAEANLVRKGKRKIYFIHPFDDSMTYLLLLRNGYRCEGILEEPYTPGQHVLVISKFL